MVADTVLRQLSGKFAAGNHDVEYVYAFCLNGCVGMIKAWLSSEHRESTKHIAELTNRMICLLYTSFHLGKHKWNGK